MTRATFRLLETNIYYYYKSYTHDEPIGWRPQTEIEAKQNFVGILNEKNQKSNVAYEDIRTRPSLHLKEDLSSNSLRDYIES